ncbi:MAG TPA: hypothetical protein VFZ17_13430 [Acidimicrobiia bacterium]|nr:hypothetical protein [Acidimicrobiia bacterium]
MSVAVGALFVGSAGAAETTATKCADPSGTVKIGMSYFGNVGSAVTAVGGEGDLVPADQAIVDGYKKGIAALNAEGGLAGCQVEGVFFNFKATGSDFNQNSQQECAAMTQDNEVVAMFGTAFETKVAVDCFAKAKTPLFQIGTNYAPTCADYQKYAGYLYNPSGIATCRFGAFIDIWKDAGLFPKDAKVGILVQTDGSGANEALANKVWGPRLKKLKIPYETFEYTGSTSAAAFSEVNAALANAVLKFKADGVNVVLLTPGGGQGIAAFTGQANTQGYFPVYGIDSADGFGNAVGIAPNATMKGAVGISYAILDLPLTAQQALPANSAITECATWTTPSTTTLTGASPFCDYINILHAALGDAKDTTPASLKKGIEGLGTSFVSSLTYDGKTKFGKNRYTGGIVARVLQYDTATDTFVFMPDQKPRIIP